MPSRARLPRFSSIPPYTELEQLGQGGTARVVKVELAGGHVAALKIPLEPTAELEHLARREWSMIGGLRIPAIVPLLAPPEQGKLLMPLCAGPTLDRYRGKLDLITTLEVLSACAAALELIHAHGIVHADIKTQNIFLPAPPDQSLRAHLWFARFADFSLGRLESEPEAARAGHGTIGFMAPELIREQRSSVASDLFAFGVMAYELLTGVHPYLQGSSDPTIVAARICESIPEPPSHLRTEIPPSVDELILRLLNRDPDNRGGRAALICEQLAAQGCRYQYTRVFHPRWFPEAAQSIRSGRPDESVEERLIRSASWRAGYLNYQDGTFESRNAIAYPFRLRSRLMANLNGIGFAKLRAAIHQAIRDAAEFPVTIVTADTMAIQRQVLLGQLHPRTIRIGAKGIFQELKDRAELSRPELLPRLALMAGEYREAARIGSDAAITLASSGESGRAIALLQILRDEIRASGQEALSLGLTLELGNSLRSAGLLAEAEPELLGLAESESAAVGDSLRAETHNSLGILYHQQEKFEAGKTHLSRALQLFEQLGNQLGVAKTNNNLGNLLWLIGDYPAALRCYRRALKHQRQLEAEREIASTLNNTATVYCMLGNFDRALRLFRLSLERNKSLGIQTEIARTLNNLGFVYHVTGRGDEAVEVLSESLTLNRRMGNQKEILFNLENLTSELISAGRLTETEGVIAEGTSLSAELGDLPHQAMFDLKLATIHRRRGHFDLAVQLIQRIAPAMARLDNTSNQRGLTYEHARLRAAVGDHEAAVSMARELFADSEKTGDEANAIQALLLLARYERNNALDEQAQKMLSGPFAVRERALFAYAQLACALADGDQQEIVAGIERCAPHLRVSGLESLGCSVILADALYRIGRIDAAWKLLTRPPDSPEIGALMPDRLAQQVLMAELAMQREEFDIAFAAIRKAVQDAGEMQQRLSETDAQKFQQQSVCVRMSQLVGEISGRLKKKKRTG